MIQVASSGLDAVVRKFTGPAGLGLALLGLSILGAVVIAYAREARPRSPADLFRFMFPVHILKHPSARADFTFWISRKAMNLLIALPSGASIAALLGYGVHASLVALLGPVGHPKDHLGPLTVVLFTVTMLLAYDISYYLYHNAQHRIPTLWELHKVHHSAEVMVGTTKDRIHPIDDIMNRIWDGIVTGPVYGVWLFCTLNPVEATILGVNVYILRNIIMMDFVRHTHLKISFGRILNNIILCPHYHQLHHSTNPKHYDKNFGLMLSVWDRLFGTLAVPEPDESFSFGLADREHEEYQSLAGLYVLPVRKMGRQLGVAWRARAQKRRHRSGLATSNPAEVPDGHGD